MDVETIAAAKVPVEIGVTAEGWFSVRIPLLLPKKERGSAEYVRSILPPSLIYNTVTVQELLQALPSCSPQEGFQAPL